MPVCCPPQDARSPQSVGRREPSVPHHRRAGRNRPRRHEGHARAFARRDRGADATETWRKTSKRARISDFRRHNLRGTWASWHVRRGTPLQVLKGPGGWETMEMVQRYAHLSADHLAHSVAPLTAEPAPIPAAI